MNKVKVQDQMAVSLIEKGIQLYSEKLLNDENLMEYLNQMNRIRRFMGFSTLKKSEFMNIMSVSERNKTDVQN